MYRIVMPILAVSLLSACSTRVFENNVTASTKVKGVPQHRELGQVEARDCNTFLFIIPAPMNPKKMYSTILDETKALNGDAIVDFQMRSDGFTFIYPFFIRDCWKATGTAVKFVKDPTATSAWDAKPATTDLADTTKPVQSPSKWDASPTPKTEKVKPKK